MFILGLFLVVFGNSIESICLFVVILGPFVVILSLFLVIWSLFLVIFGSLSSCFGCLLVILLPFLVILHLFLVFLASLFFFFYLFGHVFPVVSHFCLLLAIEVCVLDSELSRLCSLQTGR